MTSRLTLLAVAVIAAAWTTAATVRGGADGALVALAAGALVVVLAMGFRTILADMAAGLVLLSGRPIAVGDRVAIDGSRGVVRGIGLVSSRIEMLDETSLLVPNSRLVSHALTITARRGAPQALSIRIGISYGSQPSHVCSVLEEAATACPLVLEETPPTASLDAFAANALEFSLTAFIAPDRRPRQAETELRARILAALRQAQIEIAFPQHDIHLRDLDVVRTLLQRIAQERAAASASKAGPSGHGPSPRTTPSGRPTST